MQTDCALDLFLDALVVVVPLQTPLAEFVTSLANRVGLRERTQCLGRHQRQIQPFLLSLTTLLVRCTHTIFGLDRVHPSTDSVLELEVHLRRTLTPLVRRTFGERLRQ